MIKQINNNGFTLIEVMSALVLSTLIFGMAAVGIYSFIYKYNELSQIAEFSETAYNCLESIKYGYSIEGQSNISQFYGVTSADSLVFLMNDYESANNYKGIKIKPPYNGVSTHLYDWFRYYLRDGSIKVDYLYGVVSEQRIQLFPNESTDNIKVTDFSIRSINNPRHDPNIGHKVISVELKAEIDLSLKGDEDSRVRKIVYKTIIARS